MKDGGRAFPSVNEVDFVGDIITSGHAGMTLREYYAGQVIMGMYAGGLAVTQENERRAAHEAWSQADAMIAERGDR